MKEVEECTVKLYCLMPNVNYHGKDLIVERLDDMERRGLKTDGMKNGDHFDKTGGMSRRHA